MNDTIIYALDYAKLALAIAVANQNPDSPVVLPDEPTECESIQAKALRAVIAALETVR